LEFLIIAISSITSAYNSSAALDSLISHQMTLELGLTSETDNNSFKNILNLSYFLPIHTIGLIEEFKDQTSQSLKLLYFILKHELVSSRHGIREKHQNKEV